MGISVEKLEYPIHPPTEEIDEEVENEELDEELEEDDEEKVYSKEQMLERGCFKANGYCFDVKPITFFETMDIFNKKKVFIPSRYDMYGDEMSDKELGRRLAGLFNRVVPKEPVKKSLWKRFKEFFAIGGAGIVDYSEYPDAEETIKWVEAKVSYNGKPIHFYDLETKFMLTKGEIANLLIYLFEFSGF